METSNILNTENDLFIVAGYIAARERLFQMSMVSSAARGELASIMGDDYLSTDIYLRTWRIHAVSKKMTEEMSEDSYNILKAFLGNLQTFRLKHNTRENLLQFLKNFTGSD